MKSPAAGMQTLMSVILSAFLLLVEKSEFVSTGVLVYSLFAFCLIYHIHRHTSITSIEPGKFISQCVSVGEDSILGQSSIEFWHSAPEGDWISTVIG